MPSLTPGCLGPQLPGRRPLHGTVIMIGTATRRRPRHRDGALRLLRSLACESDSDLQVGLADRTLALQAKVRVADSDPGDQTRPGLPQCQWRTGPAECHWQWRAFKFKFYCTGCGPSHHDLKESAVRRETLAPVRPGGPRRRSSHRDVPTQALDDPGARPGDMYATSSPSLPVYPIATSGTSIRGIVSCLSSVPHWQAHSEGPTELCRRLGAASIAYSPAQ
jgi:hypothetical protein